ncbi:MAG: cytochrome c3 family protein [Planctomycetota bacterium]
MSHLPLLPFLIATATVLGGAAAQQGESIVQTKHNLSPSGPGAFRAQDATGICIFCHAPHKATQQKPLWNRNDTTTSFLTYSSSTFQGAVEQPNGTSKLCLSCHDGTIALGSVVSLGGNIPMAQGHEFLDSGPAALGANLRDDHPISFPYASSRGGSDAEYVPPAAIQRPVHLDAEGLVQCTSCHDPHKNLHGAFLHVDNRRAGLCLACHQPTGWSGSAHANSPKTWNGTGANPWPAAAFDNVADNGCANCHRQHGAGQPQRLLVFGTEEENCLRCHDGNVASQNIASEVAKPSAHSPVSTLGVHDPTEDPATMARHAECQDCHDPHMASAGTAVAPGVPSPVAGIGGVNSSGSPVTPILFGYELCYKCHGDNHGSTVYVPRQFPQANVRLEFNIGNPSFHPVEGPGRNTDVPSLIAPWTVGSRVACTDCHDSNASPAVGGSGPRGPHGSTHRPLLSRNYTTTDNTPESASAYALCYSCHSRTSILNDSSFREHRKHIVEERSPCSACHDSHGISAGQGNPTNNSNLIHFDVSIVRPQNGVIQFVDTGARHGNCTLVCHGEGHNRESY